ncbi:MAG: polyphosphate polymerase domain-containing protein [Bacteroidales bacterium]|nr:polyphosphate polymerase domain-containing protein [Bacteroidales bacterium]
MNSLNDIRNLLSGFDPISLTDMDSVKLLNRSEKKFVLHFNRISSVLKEVISDYKVLEINDERILEYNTEYFDTSDNAMYLAHHNGKQSRFKVRRREYVISGEQFLEVKRRTNSGRVQKKRVELQGANLDSNFEQVFIEAATPYKLDGLEMKLINTFQRITLVSIPRKERITIDVGLEFKNDHSTIQLPSVAIIEVKFDRMATEPGFEKVMKKLRIHGSSVSKYCIGRALLEPKLKSNLFQNKIRYLTKLNALVNDHRNNA